MKLRFRLPVDEREDALEEPPTEPKLPTTKRAREAIVIGLAALLGCQLVFPLAIPILLIFAIGGACAGGLLALQEREAALLGLVVWWLLDVLFHGPEYAPGWVARTIVIFTGAAVAARGIGFLVRRAKEGAMGDIE